MTWNNVVAEDPQILVAAVQNLVAWATRPVDFVHLRHTGIIYGDNGRNVNACWTDSNETVAPSLLAVRGEYSESAAHAASLSISLTFACSGFSLMKFWHNPTLPGRPLFFPSQNISLLAEHLAFFYQETIWNTVTAYFIWISMQWHLCAAVERTKQHTFCVLSFMCTACWIN
jgi:hypothetical protein